MFEGFVKNWSPNPLFPYHNPYPDLKAYGQRVTDFVWGSPFCALTLKNKRICKYQLTQEIHLNQEENHFRVVEIKYLPQPQQTWRGLCNPVLWH